MVQEVDMKLDDETVVAQPPVVDEKTRVLTIIKQSLTFLDKAVSTLENRYTTRALRSLAAIRSNITSDIASLALTTYLPSGNPLKDLLISYFPSTSSDNMAVDSTPAENSSSSITVEAEVYLGLLVVIFLYDQKSHEKALALVSALIEKYVGTNRRSLDAIIARLYFYFTHLHELNGTSAELRPSLLAAYRTASLRHDDETQAALLNALLRNYLDSNLVDQADKLVAKTTFPESASNNQIARFTYYLGRIKAIQLDYSAAYQHLSQAIRKSPQSNAAAGFHQTVTKLLVIVQLLMGEIPDRGTFRQPTLRKALVPYFNITQAVRVGNLSLFQETLAAHGKTFREDKNLTLILRLRHNVIKAGVRRISLSYSRVSLRDICLKLQLDSEEDAEFIVAKSIRDGVIDAVIDHEKGWMKSSENPDIYSTNEPQNAFHQRIQFCLNLHNESVKALRFPSDAHRKDLSALIEQDRFATPEDVLDAVDADDDMGDF